MDKQSSFKPKTGYPSKEHSEVQYLKDVQSALGNEYFNILIQGKDYNKFTDKIKEFIWNNYNDITTSQLRNIFSKVKKIKGCKELYLLRPKLAYVYGRTDVKKIGMKKLLVLLDDQIKKVKDNQQLEEFKDFFESIIAYHKFSGGKD